MIWASRVSITKLNKFIGILTNIYQGKSIPIIAFVNIYIDFEINKNLFCFDSGTFHFEEHGYYQITVYDGGCSSLMKTTDPIFTYLRKWIAKFFVLFWKIAEFAIFLSQ